MADPESLYCYVHPDRETMLRCNNCERPICSSCAVLTPTGYRCRECVRGQQKAFETAQTADYILAPLVAAGLSLLGSFVIPLLGFFTIFLAPLAGTAIAEVISRVTGRRRSKNLFYLAAGAAAFGALPMVVTILLSSLAGMQFGGLNLFGLLPLVYRIVYLVMVTGSVFYRLAGIRL
jgi:hypothetical protein